MTRNLWPCMAIAFVGLWTVGCPSAGPADPNANDNHNGHDNGNDNSNQNDNTNSNNNGNDNTGDDLEAGVIIDVSNEGAQHVPVGEQVTYESNPPASGPHWSSGGIAPVPAGVYEEALEEEQWVHNLEHGYVVVLFDCGGPCLPSLLDDLQDLFDAAPPSELFGNVKLVISPYSGLPFAFAAVAWDHQLHLETMDEAAILDFYSEFVDQGPEAVP